MSDFPDEQVSGPKPGTPARASETGARSALALKRLAAAVHTIIEDPKTSEISLRMLAVLLLVASSPPRATVRTVSSALRIRPAHIGRVLNALEARSLMRRVTDQNDSRIVLLEITDHARQLLRRIGNAVAHSDAV